jgi:hypothetical protein
MSLATPAAGESETTFLRDVNDRVHLVLLELGTDGSPGQYLCECARPGCLETVELEIAQYEAIRSSGGTVTAAGHEK